MSGRAVKCLDAGSALTALLAAGKSIRRASWVDGLTLQPGGHYCLFRWAWPSGASVTQEERCTSLGDADLYGSDWEIVS